jgi:hypothetical protein
LRTVSQSSTPTGLCRVSSCCHSEAGRSHSEEEQRRRRICALPNQTFTRGVVVVADGRWRERRGDGMKKQSKRDLVRAEAQRQTGARASTLRHGRTDSRKDGRATACLLFQKRRQGRPRARDSVLSSWGCLARPAERQRERRSGRAPRRKGWQLARKAHARLVT